MVTAFVMMKVGANEYEHMSCKGLIITIKDNVEKLPEVVEAHCVFGHYDVIAKVKVNSWNELAEIVGDEIRTMKGVAETETLVAYGE